MLIFKRSDALQEYLENNRLRQNKIGFIPTMGAIHPGHVSLVNQAEKENNTVVCSIFVNPTQFNDPDDFIKYPVTLENDIVNFEKAGCDVLFIPSVNEIYPDGTDNLRGYDLGSLDKVLEGKFRPGHFQGVCQVVHRLLEMVTPDNLYLGQKDYQQCMVIKKLIALIGAKHTIKVNICPTLREVDGLAISSRNVRLSADDRKKATTISTSLRYIKENSKEGDLSELKKSAKQILLQNGFRIDYIEIADAKTLELLEEWDGKRKIVALAAAFLGDVRLIDNMVIDP